MIETLGGFASGSGTIVVAGGGTGGHVFPGIAVADAILERDADREIVFVGTADGLEARAVPRAGYPFREMSVPPLKDRDPFELVRGGLELTRSGAQALSLLRELQPSLVLGAGGYVSGPMTLAAALAGIPTFLLEQNAEPGMTTRALAKFADRAYVAFDRTAGELPDDFDCRVVGNPVRESIRSAAVDFEYSIPDNGPIRLLVTGGSGGARSLNRRLPRALSEMGEVARRLDVLHQYGEGRDDGVREAYEGFAGEVELVPFIDDMARAYRRSHLVLCRAGATTLAEVLTFGLPAVYVPSPHVADDHQADNAREVAEAGAGIMLDDDQVGSRRAVRLIGGLVRNPNSLRNLAARAGSIRRRGAAGVIAEASLEQIG